MTSTQHTPAASQNRLYITQKAKLKQDRIVALCPVEVGWVGTIKQHGSVLVVEDVFLPIQEVSGTSVDVEPDDFGIMGLMERFPDDVPFMRYFGHSHVNMSSYFSSVDTGQIEDWKKYGLTWCVNHVQNKKGESQTRFDMFEPFHFAIDIPQVVQLIPSDIEEWVKKELKENVTQKVRAISTGGMGIYGGHHNNYQRDQEAKRKSGDYHSWVNNIKKEYVNHFLVCETSLSQDWVKLYDVESNEMHEFTGVKNADAAEKTIMQSTERRMREKARKAVAVKEEPKEVISAEGGAEGKAQRPGQQKLLGQGSQDERPRIPTASEAKSEQSGRLSETRSARVRRLLLSDDIVSEVEAAEALYAAGEDDELGDFLGESNEPEIHTLDDADYELMMLAHGFGFSQMSEYLS